MIAGNPRSVMIRTSSEAGFITHVVAVSCLRWSWSELSKSCPSWMLFQHGMWASCTVIPRETCYKWVPTSNDTFSKVKEGMMQYLYGYSTNWAYQLSWVASNTSEQLRAVATQRFILSPLVLLESKIFVNNRACCLRTSGNVVCSDWHLRRSMCD